MKFIAGFQSLSESENLIVHLFIFIIQVADQIVNTPA